jgi:hypothetical protein
MSIMQSLVHSERKNINLVSSTLSTIATIQVPTSPNAAVGDLAILFDTAFSTSTSIIPTTVVPGGWNVISNQSASRDLGGLGRSSIRSIISYRFLTSGNLGSTITGMDTPTRKILLIFRPNFTTSSINFLPSPILDNGISGNGSATHELSLSQNISPLILITHGASSDADEYTLTASGNSTTTISNAANQVKYAIFNSNEPPNDASITLTANVFFGVISSTLQSFFIVYT